MLLPGRIQPAISQYLQQACEANAVKKPPPIHYTAAVFNVIRGEIPTLSSSVSLSF